MIKTNKLSKIIQSSLLIATVSFGLPLNTASALTWQYFSQYNNIGRSTAFVDLSSKLPPQKELVSLVINRLPYNISVLNNPTIMSYLNNDEGANVILKEPANVTVTFLDEEAGYINSIGFFKFKASDLTTLPLSSVVDTILFPSFDRNSLFYGEGFNLGKFAAGDAIGFTIVSNGGWPNYNQINNTVTNQNIFRTIKRFNPETTTNPNLSPHTILFAYPEKQLLILVIEDLNRTNPSANYDKYTSDDDFNDAIIGIHVEPFSAVDCRKCNPLVPPTTSTTQYTGESGIIHWREITSPSVVSDTLEQQKALLRKQKTSQ